jgi:hypothetical protein
MRTSISFRIRRIYSRKGKEKEEGKRINRWKKEKKGEREKEWREKGRKKQTDRKKKKWKREEKKIK